MRLPRLALVTLLSLALPVLAAPARAETTGGEAVAVLSIADLGEVLKFDSLFDVLHAESIARADELAETMLAQGADPRWDRAVEQVYDLPRIRAAFNRALRVQLAADPVATAEIRSFFASDLGQRILGLEIAARQAFLDIAKEEAARVAADTPATAREPKWRLIQRLITAGDLVETNVAGSLSGNLSFSMGLQDSGAYGMVQPVEALAAEAWGQEAQLRNDITAWLKAYFGLAYAPLSEAELEAYVTFLESPAGHRYSSAVSTAFDAAFRQTSYDLGHAVGTAMQARGI